MATSTAAGEIVVTGRPQRGAVKTDVRPEVSLNSAVIDSLGAADLTEVFRELAPEIGIAAGTSTTPATPPVVLVNGQRIAGFSSVRDFPPEAVSRIDIFPEKVALQYGYGPDQRVVNIVLRDRYRALTVLGRYTAAPESGRDVYRAKVDLVRIGETSHWNVSLDYSHVAPVLAATTLADQNAPPGYVPPRHTYGTSDDHLILSGVVNRPIGAVTTELTGSLDLDTMQGRPGLTFDDGALLASEGLGNLIGGPLQRRDDTAQARMTLTLNGDLGKWRWSTISRLDETTRETRTGIAPADANIGAILPSPALFGSRCAGATDPGCVSTTTRRAGTDIYVNGDLVPLPAGNVTAAVRTGFAFAGVRGTAAATATDLTRDEGSAQANIDIPLASSRSKLGRLSVGFNGEVHGYSDYGTLGIYGSTLDWAPLRGVDILLVASRLAQPPSLLQLGQAPLTTPDLREFDFAAGTTTIVQRIEGGNSDLRAEKTNLAKARLQVSPIPRADLTLSAEYTLQRIWNPILSLTAATADTAAAFPSRFSRINGFLTALDVRPVNGARRDTQQIRWGLTYSTGFGSHWAPKAGADADRRDQLQIALYDTWRFKDDVVLRGGLPALDLLGGGIIGDDGGTPRHRVELQTSVVTQPLSVDVNAVWQAPNTARGGALPSQQLTFSQGATINLRLQINLASQHWLTRHVPWVRGSLNLSADNVFGAHLTVHDATGSVPSAYSRNYLNPVGRTFRITLRKRFR